MSLEDEPPGPPPVDEPSRPGSPPGPTPAAGEWWSAEQPSPGDWAVAHGLSVPLDGPADEAPGLPMPRDGSLDADRPGPLDDGWAGEDRSPPRNATSRADKRRNQRR
ncbi:hypothetical protein [Asanoa siamensis]|uniref:Uncharacterized protein n=1 Tax=Asanoa siamensis TaxID=926357 RepID=A0ABQ4CZW5_9ACTN|nr:hypothetical protein [Asanoa siamensis]GIF76830.1 hypothetical protein Asi02nite_63480 [Asanoa siamensis]